jgi:hypothetical protein
LRVVCAAADDNAGENTGAVPNEKKPETSPGFFVGRKNKAVLIL